MASITKAREILDAEISFVSLVNKAANKRKFLITKADDGKARFEMFGKIITKNAESHYVTGVVYEPMTEDTDGDFMTADTIAKTAYGFMKNGIGNDVNHSFELQKGTEVVESWIAKADCEIEGQTITKGTWLMTVEITDNDLWEKVEKGEITGFSMGGTGTYSTEDTDISGGATEVEKEEKKSFLAKMAKLLGIEGFIAKGEVKDSFNDRTKGELFYQAWYALSRTLEKYNYKDEKFEYENEEAVVREALTDFSDIVTDILLNEKYIAKALKPTAEVIAKSGKKMSAKNKETLSGIYASLGEFVKEFDEPESEDGSENENEKEDVDMTKEEVKKMIKETITEVMNPETEPVAKSEGETPVTMEAIAKMVKEEVAKAMNPEQAEPEQPEAPITAENIAKMVKEAVTTAVEPIRKHTGMPSNLSDGSTDVQKNEEFYLHGIF
jgi:6-pyruvoyl-tetrahydropterin synthase